MYLRGYFSARFKHNVSSVTKDTTDGKHGPLYKKFQGRGVK